jgi:hypothetical protein
MVAPDAGLAGRRRASFDCYRLDESAHDSQPSRKLTISNLRVNNWDTAAIAGFNYVLEGGTTPVKGVNTMTFKKTGNDWQIVMIHGAVDTVISQH